MNVVELMGGLGNQLFQLAFGLALEKTGRQVAFDTSWFIRNAKRDLKNPRLYCLDKFQIPPLRVALVDRRNPEINEEKVGFNLNLFQMKNDNNFRGYWQYYSYYLDILPILRQSIQVKSDFYTPAFLEAADRIIDTDSVSVHVRRGDYINKRKGNFSNLPAKYYFDAIQKTKGDLFIFSDDIPWCKQTFDPLYFSRKVYFINQADYLSFELMKFCKKHIICNSTFSMWAAMLDDNLDKQVWCPQHYPGDSVEFSDTHRWPEDWIKLEDYV